MLKPTRTLRLLNIIGPRVRSLRYKRGWSQAAMATKCQLSGWDVSRDTIANVELRRRWVPDFEVVLLARVLGVAASDLLPKRIISGDIPVGRRG